MNGQAVFVGVIAMMWLGALVATDIRVNQGTALMYAGFIIAQIGMFINALH